MCAIWLHLDVCVHSDTITTTKMTAVFSTFQCGLLSLCGCYLISVVIGGKWREVKSLRRVRLFATPWTVAYKSPLSTEFSRQEYWSGLLFPSPGDLPDPGIEPMSPALQADPLPTEPVLAKRWQSRDFRLRCVVVLKHVHKFFDISSFKKWSLLPLFLYVGYS